ncbi:hypothetical protein LOC71_19515 [Rhodopirellula sp. JC740]|uniref:Uncharacterized protein n=1 Tax=Rhodopirellula halodulae TaxID=2894198 RepID=A0ABS8NLT0_9BACT|nr:hypothetical protein [Rhodopirellula sp. JC740]MCC9644466.1 hypothetical protein [Rhodopirellula sp. JC740]
MHARSLDDFGYGMFGQIVLRIRRWGARYPVIGCRMRPNMQTAVDQLNDRRPLRRFICVTRCYET